VRLAKYVSISRASSMVGNRIEMETRWDESRSRVGFQLRVAEIPGDRGIEMAFKAENGPPILRCDSP
jgi:hypothetical protein